MKNIWILLLVALLLCGCAAEETFEKVEDVYSSPASTVMYDVSLVLPEEAAKQTIQQETDVLYICDNYLLTVQELDGGDLNRTVKQVTGFDKDALTLIETKQNGFKRWYCAWTVSGDEGQQVCRTVIIDDGIQHHAVTVMADHSLAAKLSNEWQQVLGSVTLVSTD